MESPTSEWVLHEDRIATHPPPGAEFSGVSDGVTGRSEDTSDVETRAPGGSAGAPAGLRHPYTFPDGSVSSVERLVRHVPNYNYGAVWAINYVSGILEALLVLRLLLKLLGASPEALFTVLVYALTSPFVLPFQGIFPYVARGPYVFESSAAVAIVVYPLVARALTSVIRFKTTRQTPWDETF